MHDHVVIITGNEPLDPLACRSIPSDTKVIAADGGTDHARTAGFVPSLVVGDLDSISPDGLAWAERHATIERHPVGKDYTDTELAIQAALRLNPERLVLLAGGGDRLDHTLAAIGALGAPGVTAVPIVECWWGAQYARIFHGPTRADVHVSPGTRVSVLALHGACEGVVVRGTRWEVDDETLPPLVGRGVSNIVDRSPVSIEVGLGVLTVFIDPPVNGPEEETRP